MQIARDALENDWRAIKSIKKREVVNNNLAKYVATEVMLLRCLDHPFIVKLLGHFHDDLNFYLVLELLPGGDLRRRLSDIKRLPVQDAQFYASHLVSALDHLHKASIVYRNLRPENVCIDRFGYAKLVDLVLAKLVKGQLKARTLCGDPEYVAPEILLQRAYGKEVDAWALGIFIFEMLVGHPPFCGLYPFETYQLVLRTVLPHPPHLTQDKVANALVTKLCTKHPKDRLSVTSAKESLWFANIQWRDLHHRIAKAPFVPSINSNCVLDHFDNLDINENTDHQNRLQCLRRRNTAVATRQLHELGALFEQTSKSLDEDILHTSATA